MSMQTVRVVLDITFDNETSDHPANWRWSDLLDMPGDDGVSDGERYSLVSAD